MKKFNLSLVLGMLLVLPMMGHAQIIYTDSFESDSEGTGNPPVGWALYGSGLQYPPYVSPTDVAYVGTATDTGMGFVTYTSLDGTQAFYVVSQGNADSNPNTTPVPGIDHTVFSNANVGSTFQAGTTYTLTYLAASRNLFGGASTGTMAISLMGNSTIIGASTQTIGTLAQDGNFASGPTVTFDTASNPTLIGQNIGISAAWTNTSETFTNVGWDNFVITATPDAVVPEPSTYALLGMGFLALIVASRRKAVPCLR